MISFGSVPIGSVLPVFFSSYGKTNGESITLTGLAVADIKIYKGTSMTERASTAGFILLDTDGIDLDGITGIHGVSIDTGDDTDAGFYAAGSFFNVVISTVTVDSQTVSFIAATFRLTPAEATAGVPNVDVQNWKGAAAAAMTGDAYARLGAPVGASVSADVAAVKAVDDAIKTKTDFLPSATAGAAGGLFIAGTNAPVTITGSGDALTLTSTGGNGCGLNATANGSGDGVRATGGLTGDGIQGFGGTNGNGFHVKGNGTGGGILAEGGSGASNGIQATSGAGGSDIVGNIVGNVTGNLSGSVGSVTGLNAALVDVAISTRLAAASYTAPDNATIAAIDGKTTNLPADPADESLIIAATDAIAALIGTGGAGLTALGDARLANLDAAVSTRAVAGDAMTLTSGERDAIATAHLTLANGVESGVTVQGVHRLAVSALGGKLSGAATTNIKARDKNDTKNRIDATVDADGNRTSVTLDLS